jgi:hypothetical protein
MKNRLAIFAALLMALFLPSAAHATDPYLENNGPLPTAASPPAGKWTAMRAASHEATGKGATEQCDRNRVAGLIALSAQQCAELGQRLDAGEGRVVGVPDGIVFNINNGRRDGVSYTTQLVEKRLGRIDRAELLLAGEDEYGNRYYAYFFRGEKTSCNNIVWVILPPPPMPIVVRGRVIQQEPKKQTCRLVRVDSSPMQQSQLQFLPGFLLASCCPTCVGPTFIAPMFLQNSNSSGDAVTYMQVCD